MRVCGDVILLGSQCWYSRKRGQVYHMSQTQAVCAVADDVKVVLGCADNNVRMYDTERATLQLVRFLVHPSPSPITIIIIPSPGGAFAVGTMYATWTLRRWPWGRGARTV